MTGRCRFCGCTYHNPCPAGCGWANREQTLCSECRAIDRAWQAQPASLRLPNMVRAFFRGFTAATDDARALETRNPYRAPRSRTSRFWEHGFAAGTRLLRTTKKESTQPR